MESKGSLPFSYESENEHTEPEKTSSSESIPFL
jgi:hypothetical protein